MAAEYSGSNAVMEGLSNLSILRQIGIMIGLAASVALGFGVVLWSQEPTYRPLQANVSNADASQIVDILSQQEIKFKVDTNNGVIMVESDRIHDARLELARAGYSLGDTNGYELLDKQQQFGTSQFMEKARYHRSLEGELSKTIASMSAIRGARVHLAIPKPAVFIDQQRNPSASVMVELYPGRKLEPNQVVAIQQLVSSSIPEMQAKHVSVVDNKGMLLSDDQENEDFVRAARQLDYTMSLEKKIQQRLDDILLPIVGNDNFRAQVSADVDFTVVEQAEERFNPDVNALRSERIVEENMMQGSGAMGVPGALANTPPGGGVAPEQATNDAVEGGTAKAINERKQAAKNFELDRTVSHTRHQVGRLERLTVAVVIDDRRVITGTGEEQTVTYEPIPEAELARITALVRDAVGYDASRGDSVNVMNQPFVRLEDDLVEIPEVPLWEQQGVRDFAIRALGILLVFILVFGFLKPLLSRLASVAEGENSFELPDEMELAPEPELDEITLTGGPESLLPGPDQSYESQLNAIKGMVADDPRRVAQVVKSWLNAG
ncbi:MAG TPA: flagellar basal body M-ring protein FliF [Gammaproteobacteria bacterium]|nr:flagellar M-ring protein FliF [Gammaproteobacteria bacterium]MEC8012235.1 flagellar basal-body MS-ring/collar protein FliF [Pseudomonadota bacterium]HBF07115.1 flagellar basal body M-ring protein FliF [Gammaproteobacteria bacterium]HCK92862.1 flagellar basal body M-ring protein FliF [Gammaproteobacteria bacterium]|tara:strand:+ start:36941 stop:38590 length:1650 start_codon:yes stop_codon:yes gene_type:complete